jgi:hypothetical protein
MEDAAFLARRERAQRRQRRVRNIGVGLIGLMILGGLSAWIVPAIDWAREAARDRMLRRMAYPDPPSAPGVYPVKLEKSGAMGEGIFWTPQMPVQLGASGGPTVLTFQAWDILWTRERLKPVDRVAMSYCGLPRSDKGRCLTLTADGETVTDVRVGKSRGEAWKLDEQDEVVFYIPTEFFIRMTTAAAVSGDLDGKQFTIAGDEQAALRNFAAYLRPGISITWPK